MIRHEEAAHHVWGDPVSGYVTDRVISSTDQLHVLEYELPPGGEFRHSDANRTVFGADVMYFVVEGTMLIANPSNGEVRRVGAGEGVLMRAGTWHEAFNPYAETVRVVEFFSPPPSRGTASDFARRQAPLERALYADPRWAGSWPAAQAEAACAATLTTVGFPTGRLEFRDRLATHLRSVIVDTEFLHVAIGEVRPGHIEEFSAVSEESVLVVTEGELWVDVWTAEGDYSATTVLHPGDAMFLPRGAHERVLVRRAEPASYLLGRGSVPENWRLTD